MSDSKSRTMDMEDSTESTIDLEEEIEKAEESLFREAAEDWMRTYAKLQFELVIMKWLQKQKKDEEASKKLQRKR